MAQQDIADLLSSKLSKYGDEIVTRIRAKLLEKGHLATGELYESVTYEVVQERTEVILNIYANDYFGYVDDGRPPGKRPPFENILKWVQTRGLRPKASSGIPQRYQGLPRADRSLAFLIARKIGLEGIKPANILDTTLSEVEDPLANDVASIVADAITEIIGKGWEDLAKSINNDIIDISVNYRRK